MFWTIVALVMTVFMGGIIAYNGDVIGRRYGKRRVTLFGLRPKHTAIFITSVTGVAISAITTGVLFLVVPPVRDVILEGEAAIAQNARLTATNRRLEADIRGRRTQAEQTMAQLARLTAGLRDKQTLLDRRVAELSAASSRARTMQARADRADKDARQAQAAARVARADLVRAGAEAKRLDTANRQLAEGNVDLSRQNMDLSRRTQQLAADVKQLNDKREGLQKDNRALEQQNQGLARENMDLARKAEEIKREAMTKWSRSTDEFITYIAELEKKNKTLSEENQRLASENQTLNERVTRLDSENVDLRTRRIAVHGGEDLARTVVPAGAAPDAVRKSLLQLLHDAGQTALAKGAVPGGQARAVQVVDKEFVRRTASGSPVAIPVDEADRINAMVERIAWSSSPVCVLALAVANTSDAEPATIDFQPFRDLLVYPKGKVIGGRRLDAAQPADRVFADLVAFLKDVGRSAIGRGMIPHIDAVTGEPQVGSMDAAHLAGLMERVRAMGRRVQVTALAAGDLSAADSLNLQFRIEPSL